MATLEELGFDSDLTRNILESDNSVLFSDTENLGNELTISGSLQSENFLSGSNGYKFTNDSFEINSGGTISGSLVVGGSITGSSIHIPDEDTTANSFHTDGDGNSWWGCTQTNFTADNNNANAYILKTGAAKFQSVILGTDVVISGLQAGSSIDGQYLLNLSVDTGALTNLAVTAAKIDNATITATQIANATITGTQIDNATITGSNIAATTIEAGNIANATITGTQIAATTIAAGNIVNNTITTNQISNTAGIIGGQIDNLTITAGNIANLTITTSQIANATIVGGDIAANTITGGATGNIVAATITGDEIAATTIAAGNIAGNTITASEIAANTITASEIAASTITGTEITGTTLSAIYADLGTITAGTITGGTIQTASSGARVVLGTTGIKAYNATPIQTAEILNDGSGWFGDSTTGFVWDTTGAATMNESPIATIQDRAEDDYKYGMLRGAKDDGFTESTTTGGAITRNELITEGYGGNNGGWKLTSDKLGPTSTFNWSDNMEMTWRQKFDTGANRDASSNMGSNMFSGLMNASGNIAQTYLMFNPGTTIDHRHCGFIVGWDTNLYATSGDGATVLGSGAGNASQERTLITGITHTDFNNYRIVTDYNATYPSTSNTGNKLPTNDTGWTGAAWVNPSSVYDSGYSYDWNSWSSKQSTTNIDPASVRLDGTRFLIVFAENGSGYGSVVIATNSSGTISYGSDYDFNTSTVNALSIDLIDSTHFVVAYSDTGDSDKGKCVIGTIDGSTITYGTVYTFNNAATSTTDGLAVRVLDSTHIAIAYRDEGNSNYGTAIIGVISNDDEIAFGSEYVFDSNAISLHHEGLVKVSSTHFVISYKNMTAGNYAMAICGSISGDTISYGGISTIYNNSIISHSVLLYDATNVFFIYNYNSGGYAYIRRGTISGTSISLATAYQYHANDNAGYRASGKAVNNHILIAKPGQSGSTSGFQITNINVADDYSVDQYSSGYASGFGYNNDGLTLMMLDDSTVAVTSRQHNSTPLWNVIIDLTTGSANNDTYGSENTPSQGNGVALSWDGGTTTTRQSVPGFTSSKGNFITGGSDDTWGRTWTVDELSNANFRVHVFESSSNYQSDSPGYGHLFHDFDFDLTSAEGITGIEVICHGKTDAATPRFRLYNLYVNVYYTTSVYAGSVKFYVNDVLKATHKLKISRDSTNLPELFFAGENGLSTGEAYDCDIYNSYKLKMLNG